MLTEMHVSFEVLDSWPTWRWLSTFSTESTARDARKRLCHSDSLTKTWHYLSQQNLENQV